MTVPPSLADPALGPLWEGVRERLERNGADWRGRMHLPELASPVRPAVETLVGRRIAKTIRLDELESGLTRVGLGDDLCAALGVLGHPVSEVPAQRRAARAESADARRAVHERVAAWPEAWAGGWMTGVIGGGLLAGLGREAAVELVDSTRIVLDALAARRDDPISRVELAARHLGSAHALDNGTRLGRAVTRALQAQTEDETDRALWERAGAHPDLVSGGALTWNLRFRAGHGLAALATESNRLGVPFVLTQLALRTYPIEVDPGTVVLAVENPRVLEHAAQRRSALAVVCANGNPSRTVRLLFDQLLSSGTDLRYHGDFDVAGLEICARMDALGLTPWRMGCTDYEQALAEAERDGVDLPTDDRTAGATLWDPPLAAAFNHGHRVVHEERLLENIIDR